MSYLVSFSFIALGDTFQHWVYENPREARDPDKCDTEWMKLTQRFIPYIDWAGVDSLQMGRWRRTIHFFVATFYFIEYMLAELGALQIWANAREDQAGALAAYRHALALGNTATLPELYAAAGAKFAFDADTLRDIVSLTEEMIDDLEEDDVSR